MNTASPSNLITYANYVVIANDMYNMPPELQGCLGSESFAVAGYV